MLRTDWSWGGVVISFAAVLGFAPLLLALSAPAEPLPTEKLVSFKLYFFDRTRFPQTIRQTTIAMLLGPDYELVQGTEPRVPSWRDAELDEAAANDCQVYIDGGVITLRAPDYARRRAIADKLELISHVKRVKSQ
jgi:hypothetical protein